MKGERQVWAGSGFGKPQALPAFDFLASPSRAEHGRRRSEEIEDRDHGDPKDSTLFRFREGRETADTQSMDAKRVDSEPDRYRELLDRFEKLEKWAASLEAEVARLKRREQELLKELEEARAAQRSAAPFSKGRLKKRPRKPGRKPGQGLFRNRPEPEPTEPPVPVPLEQHRCPCGGALKYDHTERVTNTELPERPKPVVKAFGVEVWVCSCCGCTTRGRHPEVAEDQWGATAHRVGPRAMATAHLLHYGLGVTARKVPKVLHALTGLELTQGALTQDALRLMRGSLGAAYETLRARVPESRYVHTDDTGWRVKGKAAQLMVFETTGQDPVTVYQIRPRHRNEEVRELLPADYPGVVTADRGKSYDAQEWRAVKQNKCVEHLKRNIRSAQEKQAPGARSFGNRLLETIDKAVNLWRSYHAGKLTLGRYRERGARLIDELSGMLRERELKDPGNQRLLKGLAQQHRWGHLLRFLEDPQVEPSNNRAERALRLCVILRKISQCSKSEGGAEAQSGFQSVIATLARRGVDVVSGLAAIVRGANPFSPASPAHP